MHYLGGKFRQMKTWAPEIRKYPQNGNGRLVEPFVGAFNTLPNVGAVPAVCNDIHPGLISMWRAVQRGWEPPDSLDEAQYRALRDKNDWDDPMTAFAAFGCSFAGKQWGGYARGGPSTPKYNAAATTRRSILKKRPFMAHVEFVHGSYDALEIREGDTIYADPPYVQTTKYSGTETFDRAAFEDWCLFAVGMGAVALASEYQVHPGWHPVSSVYLPVTAGGGQNIRESQPEHLMEFRP